MYDVFPRGVCYIMPRHDVMDGHQERPSEKKGEKPQTNMQPLAPGNQLVTVTVPHGLQPGQPMLVQGPHGTMQVQVPPGVGPGMQFQLQMPMGPPPGQQPMMAPPMMAQPPMADCIVPPENVRALAAHRLALTLAVVLS